MKQVKLAVTFLEKRQGGDHSGAFFNYEFVSQILSSARHLVQMEGLGDEDSERVLLAALFRFVSVKDPVAETAVADLSLFHEFAKQVRLNKSQRKEIASLLSDNIALAEPRTLAEKVLWDASFSWLSSPGLLAKVQLLRADLQNHHDIAYTELQVCERFVQLFTVGKFHTKTGQRIYLDRKEGNLVELNKRIERLRGIEEKMRQQSLAATAPLSLKEVEDLFKISFRNYNDLVSVADTKAGLLINVNSIIISVFIALVAVRSEKAPFLICPSFLLISVCLFTVVLAILATRPQRDVRAEDLSSSTYQRFFFGSFDRIDPPFEKMTWSVFNTDVRSILANGKEGIYEEIFKETYNVRKVLGKKFRYLLMAYWTFVTGLLISVIAFVIQVYKAGHL